jgi:segregation and condensation protein B
MIRVAGRKNVVGSPFLYRSTKDFLVHFGLNDIRDLPRLEEFGDLIGEAINEDLVTAIENAPEISVSPDQITEPATNEEAAAAEAAALSELSGSDDIDEAPQEIADARKLSFDE